MKHDDPGSKPCNGSLCNLLETCWREGRKSQLGRNGLKILEQGRNDLRIQKLLRMWHKAPGTKLFKPIVKIPSLTASMKLCSLGTGKMRDNNFGREKSSRAKATEMKHDDPGSQPCNGRLCNLTEAYSMKLPKSQKGQKGQKLVEQGRNDLRI